MKKNLFIACLLFVATMLTGCSRSQTVIKSADGSQSGEAVVKTMSQTVIKSADGSQKVDLTGTWVAKTRNATFKMIFGSDGSFTYGCGGGSYGGPEQLSIGSNGRVRVDKEFNQWWYKGTYKTSGNILITSCDELKSYVGSIGVEKGETQNFVIRIVDNDELVIQTSGTGNTRTYKRQ